MSAMAALEREQVPQTDGPWPIPAGWEWARVGGVANVNPSTQFDHLSDDAPIPFIPMAAVSEETGRIDTSQRRAVRDVRKGYVRFREGDVIFAKITPCMENGKIAPVPGVEGACAAGSTEFHVLRPQCVDSRYLWYWLSRRAFRDDAQRNMSGSAGQLRVPADYLRLSSVPVPPLAEQRRIVTRVDELFAEIAEGEAALQRARADLDTWRRALLKAAVTGELTREWRETNTPPESGTSLLARIRAECERNGRKTSRRSAINRERTKARFLATLPKGWGWATISELAEVTGGLTKNPDREAYQERLPFLRVANVQMGRLNLSEIKRIGVQSAERERLLLAPGDLLIVEGNGSIDQIGRCALWTDEIRPCVHQNHIIKARFTEPILAAWALRWLLSPSGREAIKTVASSTSGLYTLSISKIENLPIPVPSVAEATAAVERLQNALGADADLEAQQSTLTSNVAALRQSILKSAFEGRLIPQDPNDEPASVLLAHLRAETSPAPRRPRARTKTQ